MSILNWIKKTVKTASDKPKAEPRGETDTFSEAERLANSTAVEERLQTLDPDNASRLAFQILQDDFRKACDRRPRNYMEMIEAGHRAIDYHPYRAATYNMALDILAKWNSNDPKMIHYCNMGRAVLMTELPSEKLDA